MNIAFADAFTFECGTVSDRDRHFSDFNFAAADFQRALDHLRRFDIGNDVLVSTNPGRQNLRNISVRDYGEAVVDRARRHRIFRRGDFAEGQHKRENAVFIIFQVGRVIAGFDPAEGKRRAARETQHERD